MEIIKHNGINYDYILGLRKTDNGVSVVKYPIDRHNTEIDRAIEYLNDENYNAGDIYDSLRKCTDSSATYEYCLGHEYNERHISDISPTIFNSWEYKVALKAAISMIIKKDLGLPPQADKLFALCKFKRERINQAEAHAKQRLATQIYDHKEALIKQILPYIYAIDYDATLQRYDIPNECIIFSTEHHGDDRYHQKRTIEYQVNNDISVIIDTNFCFGNASYFHVIVSYKGIKLLPYSDWVKYYYARYNELLECTRFYEPKRSSWECCMNWLEQFINSAILDPEHFIHTEVIKEVNEMMSGLEKMFTLNTEQFKNELNVKCNFNDNRYIGIRVNNASTLDNDKKYYQIMPEESALIYKMEKISCALGFINNLRKFSNLYSEITQAIDRIITMNKAILPELNGAIAHINNEIIQLTAELTSTEKQLESLKNKLNKYTNILNNKLLNVVSLSERTSIQEEFGKDNPQFLILTKKVRNLSSSKDLLKEKLLRHQTAIYKLISSKQRILKYVS